MREILFRGKLPDTGEWVEGYVVKGRLTYILTAENIHYMSVSVMGHASVDVLPVKPETVGQYTGLKDVNGKRIFEGDIVEGEYFDDEDGYGIIQWNDGAFEIVNDYTCVTFHENLYSTDLSVIGNIHDNPDLIGGAGDGK